MSVSIHCRSCVCKQPNSAHALLVALHEDDLDAALQLGLLDAHPCPGCSAECSARLLEALDARRIALAARDRHRARAERLQRRKAEREVARTPLANIANTAPALPSGAADALARALAKARERRSQ